MKSNVLFSLTCSKALRKKVPRSKPFYKLLNDRGKKSVRKVSDDKEEDEISEPEKPELEKPKPEKSKNEKNEFDPDVHCGVLNKKTKKACMRNLISCKLHSRKLKGQVEGRSQPLEKFFETNTKKAEGNKANQRQLFKKIKANF